MTAGHVDTVGLTFAVAALVLNAVAWVCLSRMEAQRDAARRARDANERVIAALEANLKDAYRSKEDMANALAREMYLRQELVREVEKRGIWVNFTRYSDLNEFTREDRAPIVERET